MDYWLTPTSMEGFTVKLITDLTTKEDDFLPHGRNRILPIDCHYKWLQEWESNPPWTAYETALFNQNSILQ